MRNKSILLSIMTACVLLESCGGWSIGYGGGSSYYNCNWHNDKNAAFHNVYLLSPESCDNNECRFENPNFINFNGFSIYSIFETAQYGYYGGACELKWDVEIVPAKLCSYGTSQSQSVILNNDNYASLLSSQDVLEGTPYVPESTYIYPDDYKHTFTLQIHNVTNWANNTEGTITWTSSWDTITSVGVYEWGFTFPGVGLKGTFTPDNGFPRYIYKNGNYQHI